MRGNNYYNRSQLFTPPPNYGGTIKYSDVKNDKIGVGEGKFIDRGFSSPSYSPSPISFQFPKADKIQSSAVNFPDGKIKASEANTENQNGRGGKPDIFASGAGGIFVKNEQSNAGKIHKDFSEIISLDGISTGDILLIALIVTLISEKASSGAGDDILIMILCILLLKK